MDNSCSKNICAGFQSFLEQNRLLIPFPHEHSEEHSDHLKKAALRAALSTCTTTSTEQAWVVAPTDMEEMHPSTAPAFSLCVCFELAFQKSSLHEQY